MRFPLLEPKVPTAPVAETIGPTIPVSRTSLEPGLLADLKLTVPTREAACALVNAHIELALSAAIAAMVVPGSSLTVPVQPAKSLMSHASAPRASIEPRRAGHDETPIQSPSAWSLRHTGEPRAVGASKLGRARNPLADRCTARPEGYRGADPERRSIPHGSRRHRGRLILRARRRGG